MQTINIEGVSAGVNAASCKSGVSARVSAAICELTQTYHFSADDLKVNMDYICVSHKYPATGSNCSPGLKIYVCNNIIVLPRFAGGTAEPQSTSDAAALNRLDHNASGLTTHEQTGASLQELS